MKPLLTLIIALFILLAPNLSLAQDNITRDGIYTGGGIIPCGQSAANPCNSCDVVVLANTVIKWLIGITFMFFAVMAVITGVKLVMAGGNSGALSDAKEAFTNLFIGLIIVLGAWLFVDTLLRFVLEGGETGNIQGYGPWSQVKCIEETIPGIEKLSISEEEFKAIAASDPDLARNLYAVGTGGGNCQADTAGACSASSLSSAFGAAAGSAATILGAESGCNPNSESKTDTTTDGRTYSVGLWQINLSTNKLSCNGKTLNCPSAFQDAGYRNRYNVKVKKIVNESLYRECVQLAKDPTCNSNAAAALYRNSGDFGDWACSAKKCGVSTSRNNKCPLKF